MPQGNERIGQRRQKFILIFRALTMSDRGETRAQLKQLEGEAFAAVLKKQAQGHRYWRSKSNV
jgi:hypothetical protein